MERVAGRNVRRLRKSSGLTLEQMSERLATRGHEVKLNALSRIERGDRQMTVSDLVAFAEVLGVSVNKLLADGHVDEVRDAVVPLLDRYFDARTELATVTKQLRSTMDSAAKELRSMADEDPWVREVIELELRQRLSSRSDEEAEARAVEFWAEELTA